MSDVFPDERDERLIPPPIEWRTNLMVSKDWVAQLNEQIESLRFAITRWANATQVVGSLMFVSGV